MTMGDFDDECIHGMDPAWCSVCLKGPATYSFKEPTVLPEGPAFPARFPGDCPGCNLPVVEGQIIRKWSDERYRHQGCTP